MQNCDRKEDGNGFSQTTGNTFQFQLQLLARLFSCFVLSQFFNTAILNTPFTSEELVVDVDSLLKKVKKHPSVL